MSDFQDSETISRALAGEMSQLQRSQFFHVLANNASLLRFAQVSAQIQLSAWHSERHGKRPVEAFSEPNSAEQTEPSETASSDDAVQLSPFSKLRMQRLLDRASHQPGQTPQQPSNDWHYQQVAQEQSLYERSHQLPVEQTENNALPPTESPSNRGGLQRTVDHLLLRMLGRLERTLPSLPELLRWLRQELTSCNTHGQWLIVDEHGELLLSHPGPEAVNIDSVAELAKSFDKHCSEHWIVQHTPAERVAICADVALQGDLYIEQQQTYATYWKLTCETQILFIFYKRLAT